MIKDKELSRTLKRKFPDAVFISAAKGMNINTFVEY